jgi:hypothetical protein
VLRDIFYGSEKSECITSYLERLRCFHTGYQGDVPFCPAVVLWPFHSINEIFEFMHKLGNS